MGHEKTFGLALAAVGGLVLFGLSGCLSSNASDDRFEGWVEGNFIFISPDESGRIENLSVREGDNVTKGVGLFTLDSDLQKDAVAEAEAAVANAQINFDRAKELLARRVGTEKVRDDAEAALRTAQAHLNSARTRLTRRQVASPVSGIVQELYFRGGEMVQSGRPVISVLPPNEVRIRFFVPQSVVPKLSIGDPVKLQCDGCDQERLANVSFIAAEAEFTPPVIYSPEERSRLVFHIEARPAKPELLRVGQPVSVILQEKGSKSDAGS